MHRTQKASTVQGFCRDLAHAIVGTIHGYQGLLLTTECLIQAGANKRFASCAINTLQSS